MTYNSCLTGLKINKWKKEERKAPFRQRKRFAKAKPELAFHISCSYSGIKMPIFHKGKKYIW